MRKEKDVANRERHTGNSSVENSPLGANFACARTQGYGILGFGCYETWFLTLLLCPSLYADLSHDMAAVHELRILFLITFVIGGVACGVLEKSLPSMLRDSRKLLPVSLLASLGTLFMVAPLWRASRMGFALALLGGLLAGFCMIDLASRDVRHMADARSEMALVMVSIGMVLACLVTLFLAFLPQGVATVVVCAAPALYGLCISRVHASKHKRVLSNAPLQLESLDRKAFPGILIVNLAFGVIIGLAAVTAMNPFVDNEQALLVGGAVIAVGLLFGGMRQTANGMVLLTSRLYDMLYLVGLAWILAFPQSGQHVGFALICSGYIVFESFARLIEPDIVFRSGEHLSNTFGMTRMFSAVGLLCGFALGYLLVVRGLGGRHALQICCLVCIALVTVCGTCVFRKYEVMELLESRALAESPSTREARLGEIARVYRLSAREVEIATLLLRGRSVSYIKDELGIAEGTVKTHVHRIYEKLGVSSKQEFIDLVDQPEKHG